jgi:hypothetical protein
MPMLRSSAASSSRCRRPRPRKLPPERICRKSVSAGSFQDARHYSSVEEASALAIPLIAASTLVAAACALQLAPTAHGEVGKAPLPELPCNMPSAASLLIWQRAPGNLDQSEYVNSTDFYNCRPTLDTWRASRTTGPGYCAKIAWANDNPGYPASVQPAPPLKKVIDQVGDC